MECTEKACRVLRTGTLEGFRKAEFSGKVLEKLVPNQRWEEEEELTG